MTYFDIFLIIAVFILTLRGFLRGFIKEFFSIGAVVFGILAGIFFHKAGSEYIRNNFIGDINYFPEILAFIILFIIVYIICMMVQKILNDVIMGLNLSGIDKFLGGIMGLAEGIIFICIILFVIVIQPVFDSSGLLSGSFFAGILLPLIIDTARFGAGSIIYTAAFYSQKIFG